MNSDNYFYILGITPGSTEEEIRRAYRRKAREFHPDLNHSPDAEEKFITVTEAYDFLLSYHGKFRKEEEELRRATEEWRQYRQAHSRHMATEFARKPYSHFRNTGFYKSTRIYDNSVIVFSFIISIIVITESITGYVYKLRNPEPGIDKPVFTFILLISVGLVFLGVTVIYFIASVQSSRRRHR
jgi:DnaJ domain